MASQLQEFINLGQQMNLSGDELMKFAREMVADMKAQRLEDRRLEAEKREFEIKLKIEKSEAETKKREAETKQLEVQAKLDLEKQRIAHDQQMDLERLKLQQIQCENDARIRLDEIRARSDEIAAQSHSSSSVETQSHSWNGKRFDLGIGQFDNVGENLDSFINRFELVAKAYELPEKLWAIELSKSLNGPSLEIYEMLDNESKTDFDSLVQALRKRFGITEGSYRKLFKTSKPQKNERLSDFVWRL
jgi:hypothetical protein